MHWLRFRRNGGEVEFGYKRDEHIVVCRGDMFGAYDATDEVVLANIVELDTPCVPGKVFALWNNFRAAAAQNSWDIPSEPLYFFKAANSFCRPQEEIRPPRSHPGRVIFEGELGIVIGRGGRDIALDQGDAHIFGYTCVNDVTALDLLREDTSFTQWSRAKSFDSFTPFGPCIATDVDPATLLVRVQVNGRERQNYPVADMIFSPRELVSLLSRDVTLLPGDLIACGTSVGASSLKPGATVEVIIEGIGTLANRYGERE
jgi:2-keto-4-pentenoate hydratase/2-oxohepta-3-ene-1,7-dioic acid hydratase in catechol pathway